MGRKKKVVLNSSEDGVSEIQEEVVKESVEEKIVEEKISDVVEDKIDESALMREMKDSFSLEEVQLYDFACELCKGKNVVELNHGYSCGIIHDKFLNSVKSLLPYSCDREKVGFMKKLKIGKAVRYSNMEQIEGGDSLVDVVLVFDTIQHLDNPEKLIDEVKRVLVPNGILLISASTYQGLQFLDSRHKKEYTITQFIGMVARKFNYFKIYKLKPMSITEVQDGSYDGNITLIEAKNT
jgi:SAM-dependent methyltransferase